MKKHIDTILRDNRTRSALKSLTYRIGSVFITSLVTYLILFDIKLALTIGGVDALAKMLFYYFHERVWHYSSIGRY